MKLKYRPEDFVVRESWRFDEVAGGGYHVYAMDKQKLSTFQAVERICQVARIPHSAVSYCGLKDKQGRTEQLMAVKGKEISVQDADLRLRKVGETDHPLSARNTTSNRFAVTIRDLSSVEIDRLAESVAEVQRLGVLNYFDSQRFGHLKHGQGFLAKDILKGQWEHALHNYLKPSPLDRSEDAKVKAFWQEHWGNWVAHCPFPGVSRYRTMLRKLRANPRDFKGALLSLEPRERAMIVFTYQSYLWNEGVKLLLLDLVDRKQICQIPYQAGALLFPRSAPQSAIPILREGTFPLLAPDSPMPEGKIGKAVAALLRREQLTLAGLRVHEAPLFFKHEERQVSVFPGKLVVSKPGRDEHFRGRLRVRLAFTLPPGSYATLVVRRLFWFAVEESPETRAEGVVAEAQAKLAVPVPRPPPPDPRTTGFLAKKRARRLARQQVKGGTP
jgi:tRNA pseudouridine13 synthase